MYKKKKRISNISRLKLFLGVVGVILYLIFHVSMQMFILSLENQVNEIRKEYGNLKIELKNLELEVTVLRKGSRIKKIAQEKLGMEMPVGAPSPLF